MPAQRLNFNRRRSNTSTFRQCTWCVVGGARKSPLTPPLQTSYVEKALGEPIAGDLFDALRLSRGQILCDLIGGVFPDACLLSRSDATRPAADVCAENATMFLAFLRRHARVGSDELLFDPLDLVTLSAGSSDAVRLSFLLAISLFAAHADDVGVELTWHTLSSPQLLAVPVASSPRATSRFAHDTLSPAGSVASASLRSSGTGSAEDSTRDADRDAARDADRDAARDEHRDAKRDAHNDANRDADRDASRDAERDANRDADRDANRDADRDANRDASNDADREAGRDASRDASRDAQRDAERDTQRDDHNDANRDADRDASRDADRDANRDADRDAHRDTGNDAKRDADRDANRDAGRDANRDAKRDAKRDIRSDAHRDANRDANRDADRDADRDANRDTGSDAKREAARDANRDAGRDAERDAKRDILRDDHNDANRDADRDAGRDFNRDAIRDTKRDALRDAKRDFDDAVDRDARRAAMLAPDYDLASAHSTSNNSFSGDGTNTNYFSVPEFGQSPVVESAPTTARGNDAAVAYRQIDYDELIFLSATPVGKGAFGVVYAATFRGFKVAVKKLLTFMDDEVLASVRAECQLMAMCNSHPNIVNFVGAARDGGTICIVTEFCPGGSLYDHFIVQRDARAPAEALRTLRDAANGIIHLHKERVIHRDIAARNVLLEANGNVRVTDFGLARIKTAAYQSTKSSIGPVRYMAPESIASKRFNEATDAFAFGVLMWEVTHRSLPFADLDSFEVATSVVNGSLRLTVDPQQVCSDELVHLMQQCWVADAALRPSFPQLLAVLSAVFLKVTDEQQ
jgi:predicted Ser/Thr protein kinase